jgi:ubiquinone/menaquinone biosynthesis C-methylase UbiE
MLHNFINRRDFYDLFHAAPTTLSHFTSRIKLGEQQRIKSAWGHVDAPPTNWWDIPAVLMRWNFLITGSASTGYHQYIAQKWLSNRSGLSALSLGCGTGHNELCWVNLHKFERIDAYDLSTQRIQAAAAAATASGHDKLIRYVVGNVFDIDVKEDSYDVIMVEQSLHHFSPLDKILSRIATFLKRDGYFVVNEFVGPTRFQWTDRQIEVVNGLLAVLPTKYKTLWQSSKVKKSVIKPSHLRMILGDPSEAIESEKIAPLLRSIFDIVEFRGYGGSILHLLFNGIAHNFLKNDAETNNYLKMIFQAEDLLLQSQDIQHDFVVAVCRKR